jgi:hypothetical protein
MAFEEIKAKLGLDVTDFERGVAKAQGSLSNVVEGATKKLTDFKNVGQTIATALGLNLESIAEGLARMIVGFSKEQEASLLKLVDTSKAAADEFEKLSIKKRGGDDPAVRQQQLETELNVLRKQAEATKALTKEEKAAIYEKYNKPALGLGSLGSSAALAKASEEIRLIDEDRQKRALEINEKIGKINNQNLSLQIQIDNEINSNNKKAGEQNKKTALESLSTQERLKKIDIERSDALAIIYDSSKSELEKSKARVDYAQLNNDYLNTEKQLKKEQADIDNKIQNELIDFFGDVENSAKKALDTEKAKTEELKKQGRAIQDNIDTQRRQSELPTMAEVISGKRNIGSIGKNRATALEKARAKELSLSDAEQRAREAYSNAPTESARAAALAHGKSVRGQLDLTRSQVKGLEKSLGTRIKDADPYVIMIKELASVNKGIGELNNKLQSNSIK